MKLTTVFALMLSFLLLTCKAQCYETDVHFELTYVLCHLAGLDSKEAWVVASADESVDHNTTMTAYDLPPPPNYEQHGRDWHAFGDNQAQIKARLDVLWLRATKTPGGDPDEARLTQLIRLGQFLHFQQDYYSHRQRDGNERTAKWAPFGPKLGHFADLHRPDRIPYRPDLAKDMAADCYVYLSRYSKEVLHRNPRTLSRAMTDALIDALAKSYPKEAQHAPSPAEQRGQLHSPPEFDYWDKAEQLPACIELTHALEKIGHEAGDAEFPAGTLFWDPFMGKFEFTEGGDLVLPVKK